MKSFPAKLDPLSGAKVCGFGKVETQIEALVITTGKSYYEFPSILIKHGIVDVVTAEEFPSHKIIFVSKYIITLFNLATQALNDFFFPVSLHHFQIWHTRFWGIPSVNSLLPPSPCLQCAVENMYHGYQRNSRSLLYQAEKENKIVFTSFKICYMQFKI